GCALRLGLLGLQRFPQLFGLGLLGVLRILVRLERGLHGLGRLEAELLRSGLERFLGRRALGAAQPLAKDPLKLRLLLRRERHRLERHLGLPAVFAPGVGILCTTGISAPGVRAPRTGASTGARVGVEKSKRPELDHGSIPSVLGPSAVTAASFLPWRRAREVNLAARLMSQ